MTYGELIQKSLFYITSKTKKVFSLSEIKAKFPDLSNQEIRILATIFIYNTRGDKISASDIAKLYDITTAAVMHKLDSLEEKGYIYRDTKEEDKRVRYISITKRVEEEALEFKNNNMKQMDEIARILGDEDCRSFIRILGKLERALKEE